MNRHVYILTQIVLYERENIVNVYSKKEEAEFDKYQYEEKNTYSDVLYEVTEYEVI